MERTKPCNCSHAERYKTYLEIINARVNSDIKCFYYHLDKIKDTKLRDSYFAHEVENLRKIFNPSIPRAALAKENSIPIIYPRINFNYIEEIGIIEQLRGEARRFNNKEKFVRDFHSPDCEYLEYYKFKGTKYLYPYINWFEIVYPFFIRLSKEHAKKHKTDINWKVYKLDDSKNLKLFNILDKHKWIEINWKDFKLIFNGKEKINDIVIKWNASKSALRSMFSLLRNNYFTGESDENLYKFVNKFFSKEISNKNKIENISESDNKVIESIEKALKT
jgi:hypothetical protein